MKERPILFSPSMVRAILDGRKTQTRRVVRFDRASPVNNNSRDTYGADGYDAVDRYERHLVRVPWTAQGISEYFRCPYGVPGDRLWVREAFALENTYDYGFSETNAPEGPVRWIDEDAGDALIPRYRATQPDTVLIYDDWDGTGEPRTRWKPAIHMPRWASRLLLEVTDVRVERVQEITLDDMLAEGVASLPDWEGNQVSTEACFRALWDSINDVRGYGWAANPWVWAVSFRRINTQEVSA